MHLTVRLPKVAPLHIEPPTRCPLRDPKNPKQKCTGTHFKAHQWHCDKPIRDTPHPRVTARRYRCLKCQRSFREYPVGVSHDQQSDTLKGLSVLLDILGLSDQGVADLLEALQYPLIKSTVYANVPAAGAQAIQLREQWLKQQADKIHVLGLDFTPQLLRVGTSGNQGWNDQGPAAGSITTLPAKRKRQLADYGKLPLRERRASSPHNHLESTRRPNVIIEL